MTYLIDIQNTSKSPVPLTKKALRELAVLALTHKVATAEITIRLIDAPEMTALNHQYRKKNKPTNVLAFPSELPEHVQLDCPFLGDVVICPEVLTDEAPNLHKSLKEHWSLIVIHGVLHLLGYDHVKEADAQIMQNLEIKLLATLGFANPYDEEKFFE